MRIIKPGNASARKKNESSDSVTESDDYSVRQGAGKTVNSAVEKNVWLADKSRKGSAKEEQFNNKIVKKKRPRQKPNKPALEQDDQARLGAFIPDALAQTQSTKHEYGRKRRRSEYTEVPFYKSALSSQKKDDGQGLEDPLDLFEGDSKKEFNRLLASGIRLLGIREHSVKEITDKLLTRTELSEVAYAVVDDLLENKYLSEERFTESYVRYRSGKGFGPIKIRAELKNKGISNQLIQEYLDMASGIWFDNACDQHQKKYGNTPLRDYKEWTKRARFMQSRGFTTEHIQVTLPRLDFD